MQYKTSLNKKLILSLFTASSVLSANSVITTTPVEAKTQNHSVSTENTNFQYRDIVAEQVLVEILTNSEARTNFLNDRKAYLNQHKLSDTSREALLMLPIDQMQEGDQLALESHPCGASTFGDLFCDG